MFLFILVPFVCVQAQLFGRLGLCLWTESKGKEQVDNIGKNTLSSIICLFQTAKDGFLPKLSRQL